MEKKKSAFSLRNYGHYYYDAYYTFSSCQSEINRQEYKAMKWKCLACVSAKSILDCFLKGLCTIYDIAEELQVEEYMVEFAYNYYKDNKLILTNEEIL